MLRHLHLCTCNYAVPYDDKVGAYAAAASVAAMQPEEYADVPVSRPGFFTHRSSGSLLVSSAVHDKAVRLNNILPPMERLRSLKRPAISLLAAWPLKCCANRHEHASSAVACQDELASHAAATAAASEGGVDDSVLIAVSARSSDVAALCPSN